MFKAFILTLANKGYIKFEVKQNKIFIIKDGLFQSKIHREKYMISQMFLEKDVTSFKENPMLMGKYFCNAYERTRFSKISEEVGYDYKKMLIFLFDIFVLAFTLILL